MPNHPSLMGDLMEEEKQQLSDVREHSLHHLHCQLGSNDEPTPEMIINN